MTLDTDETEALLREVPAAYRTHINDVLLTALVQALTHWTGSSSVLLDLEGHGREDLFPEIDLSRTVGWFTSLFPVRLELPPGQSPGEAIMAIKEQLRAVPHRGIGYGLLRYLSPDSTVREQLQRARPPQISFNYLGQFDQHDASALFKPAQGSPGRAHGPLNRRSHLLDIIGLVSDNQLSLQCVFSGEIHHRSTIERFMDTYRTALQSLIDHCRSPHASGVTASDFPLTKLSQSSLDRLTTGLSQQRKGRTS